MRHNTKEQFLFKTKLLNTGDDITSTWDLAKNAIAAGLSQENSMDALYAFIEQLLSSPELENEWVFKPLLSLFRPLAESLFQKPGIKEVIALYLHGLDQAPHSVNRLKIVITELAYLHSNPTAPSPGVKAFVNHSLMFLLASSGSLIHSSARRGKTTINPDDINKTLSPFLIKPNNKNDYKTGFAFALRQSSPADVQYFLDYQEGQYLAEKNFLIFLDSVLTEFHDLFEPKTLKEVKKWLEHKQAILEEAGGELFSFSKDITKNRAEVRVNLKTFKTHTSYIKEIQKMLLRKKVLEDYYRHKRDRKNLARTTLSLELDQIFLKTEQHEEILRLIEDKPFDIFPEVISFIEKVNFISTKNNVTFEPFYRKEKAYLERRNARLLQSFQENAEGLPSFHQECAGMPLKSNDQDFVFFFAYAMRQIPRNRLRAFLNHQLGICQKPFRTLLEDTLADFEPLFEPRCQAFIQQWIHENERTLTIQANRAADGDSQSAEGGFIKIKGNLTHEQVTQAFHAFLNRTDLNKGQPFLTEADVSALCEIGLAYPKEEPMVKPIRLNISSGCKDKFFGLIYELYDQNTISRSRSGSKQDFARFLKHNFTGFEAQSIKRIANDIRRPRAPRKRVQ